MPCAVTIATYQRPRALRGLLRSLCDGGLDGADAEVVVVDNAPDDDQAAAVCAEFTDRLRIRIVTEPVPGIAAARNRAVRETRDAELVAFVDDDETADPGWLAALIAAHRATGADIVTGPVIPDYRGVPDWVVAGEHFVRPRYPTGTPRPNAATNNLLVTRSAIDALAPCFDERFGLTGGSDTLFTARAVAAGFRIVWADDAVVREAIEADRANLRWLTRRSFRLGNTFVRCDLALAAEREDDLRRQRWLHGRRHLVLAARASGRVATAAARGRGVEASRHLRDIARGLGGAWAAVGGHYQEYRRS